MLFQIKIRIGLISDIFCGYIKQRKDQMFIYKQSVIKIVHVLDNMPILKT